MARIVLHKVMAAAELDTGQRIPFTLERTTRLLSGGAVFRAHVDGRVYVLIATTEADALREILDHVKQHIVASHDQKSAPPSANP